MSKDTQQFAVEEFYRDGTVRCTNSAAVDRYFGFAIEVDDHGAPVSVYAFIRAWEGEPSPPPSWLSQHQLLGAD